MASSNDPAKIPALPVLFKFLDSGLDPIKLDEYDFNVMEHTTNLRLQFNVHQSLDACFLLTFLREFDAFCV